MKRLSQIHRPAALMILLLGAVIIAGAAFIVSCSHSTQDPNSVAASAGPPLAARVDQLDGTAGIALPTPNEGQNGPQTSIGWNKASVNTPVSVGSRIHSQGNSKVGIAFSGRNYARLNPNTSLDVLSLAQRRTQLALREGSCVFSVGALARDELFEVGTPDGAIDFTEPGLYQVGIDDGGGAVVSCLSGAAHVVGLSGSGEISKGQLLTLAAAAAAEAVVSQLSPTVAGTICNDYYSYRYPSTYDGRYADYNRYLDDPYYYDPYRRSVSYQYVPDDSEVAGLDDLDAYGDWSDVPGYGHCWRPRESSGWAPYRDGYWSDDRSLGLSWVANERWGWAPYHYGRWAFANQGWYWVPGEVVTRPVYAPALVAFVPMPEPDRVGWLPLGPGDPYVPRYYDRDYQPQYIGSTTVVNNYVNITNITNYNVPGAVTVVSTSEFTGVITPGMAQTVDPAVLARTRPVMDPYAVPNVRQMAPNMMAVKPRVEVPFTVEQSLARPVVISQAPVVPAATANTVQALRTQAVPEDARKRKFQVRDAGQPVAAVRPDGLPIMPVSPQSQGGQNAQQQQNQGATQERQARIAQLATEAAQGNKAARREVRQLQDEQRIQDKVARKEAARQQTTQQQGTQPVPQTQQAQSPEQLKAERQAARQQAQQAEQQRQTQAAQLAAQQQAQKQAARQQAQQQAQQAAGQQEQQRQQEKARRKAEQQQQVEQQAQPAAQQQQQRQQEKAKRKAEQQQTQQQAPQAAQQEQQRQQEKARRKAENQQQVQQQAPQAAGQQQRQQEKAQRRAADQQAAQEAASQQQQAADQRKAQKQAQQQAAQQQAQQAEQQRQQQKAERRAQRQNAAQEQNPQQANPSKAERKAKNKNSSQQ